MGHLLRQDRQTCVSKAAEFVFSLQELNTLLNFWDSAALIPASLHLKRLPAAFYLSGSKPSPSGVKLQVNHFREKKQNTLRKKPKKEKKGRGTWVCLKPQLLVRLTATSESKSSTVGRSVDAHRRRTEDKCVDLQLPPGGGRTRSGESDRPARSVLWGHLVARGRNSKFQAASV